jgi:hypothetical protein
MKEEICSRRDLEHIEGCNDKWRKKNLRRVNPYNY